MNNILLIPGSFNPITNAHIERAKTAKEKINASEVYFIPAHDTYVAKKKTLIPGKSRCRLIEEATPDYMTYTSLEIDSFLPVKTYDTISKFREKLDRDYKFYDFYIIVYSMYSSIRGYKKRIWNKKSNKHWNKPIIYCLHNFIYNV